MKVAAARSTASSASSPAPGSDPGDAGLRAVLDDFRAVTAEAAAMCDDVVDLAEAVERDGDAPFGVGDIAEIEREAVALAAKVREETSAAGALRPQVAEVWAENTRDETMRAELESLFERAAEDVEAAAADAEAEKAEEAAEARKAREAGGSARVEDRRRREQTWGPRALAAAASRPLPPALDRMRRSIDDDMKRLTAGMARLESDVELREREKRRLKMLEKAGMAASGAAIPWGPVADTRRGLHSSTMPNAGALPPSLARAAGLRPAGGGVSVSARLGNGFGGVRGGVRGTLVSSRTGGRPPAAASAREEALRELRRRRELIDSQTTRLEDALARADAGKDAAAAGRRTTPSIVPAEAAADSPASLASFSPVRRMTAFQTPAATVGRADSDDEDARGAPRSPASPAGSRRLAAPSDADPAETSGVVRAVLSRISGPRITSTVKKGKISEDEGAFAGNATTVPSFAAPAPSPPKPAAKPAAVGVSTTSHPKAAASPPKPAGGLFGASAAVGGAPTSFSSVGSAPTSFGAAPAFGAGPSFGASSTASFGAAKPTGGFNFGAPAPAAAEKEEKKPDADEEKETEADAKNEKPIPAATGGFSAAFLAKANAGYSKAQEALEEELKSKAAPAAAASTAAASTAAVGGFGLSLGSAPATGGFSFGSGTGATSAAFSAFGVSTAEKAAPSNSSFGTAATAEKEEEKKPDAAAEKKEEKEEKEEKPKPAATGGFSAAFLAKANAGYSKAQEALEEELKSKAAPAAAASTAAASAAGGGFSFGVGASSAASASSAAASTAPAFGLTPASASTSTFKFPGATASGGFTFAGAASSAAAAQKADDAAAAPAEKKEEETKEETKEEKEEKEEGERRRNPRRRAGSPPRS